jgi:hypothetical protein
MRNTPAAYTVTSDSPEHSPTEDCKTGSQMHNRDVNHTGSIILWVIREAGKRDSCSHD